MTFNLSRRHSKIILIALLMTCTCQKLCGQVSLHVYSGTSFVQENLGNGDLYDVWLTSLGISKKLFDNQNRFTIHGHLEMHYGQIMLSPLHGREYDLALNAQGELRWQLFRFTAFTFSVGTGPGYFSTPTPVQAKGFTFSNNIALGFRFATFKHALSIHPQIRFRHLSNGATKSPNSGIDNFLVMLGLEVPLRKPQGSNEENAGHHHF